MKKTILTSAILLTAFAGAFAQTPTSVPATEIVKSSDVTLLQVVLNSVQTIEVNNKAVVLNYQTKDDYMKGVTSLQDNHLTIFSTGGFAVNVQAKGDLVGNGDNTIESEGITVTLGPTPSLLTKSVPLSETAKTFFTSSVGESNKKYTVIYKGAGDSQYINNFKKEAGNTYETLVTYSIEAI